MPKKVQNSLQDVLKRLSVDIDNMTSFLHSLNNILISKSDNVDVSQTKDDGSKYTITVPSFGYMKGKIEDINNNFNTLINNNDDVVGIKSENGDVRKFELQKVSSLINDLESIGDVSFTVPSDFRVKNNWFFESFLNPLLFVSLDISSIITDDINRFSVKRLVINSVEDDDLAYFDTNYKGVNNLDLETVINDLELEGIDYIEDDNIVDLPTGINRYRGDFDVLRVLEEEIIDTTTGSEVSVVRRRYVLNSLQYSDVLSETEGTKILAVGDRLITNQDSEYEVTSLNVTSNEVILESVFGVEPITIGASVLKIKPSVYIVPELQVNVGFNEREIIFAKPISKKRNLTVDTYSKGFGVYTNELTIPLDDDSESTLEDYYNNFVSDFGLILLNLAKEKKVPAILAEKPDAPVLDSGNFQVIQIDSHIKEAENTIQLKSKIKEKEDALSQQKETDRKITELKSEITTKVKTAAEKQRIEKEIKKKTEDRKVLQDRISTLVRDVTLTVATTPQFVTSSKYQVRGFWQIPEAKPSQYGIQEVVQFKYRFRYLSKKGTAPNATQTEFVESNGTKKFAVFSPWTERNTKSKTRTLNEDTGLYDWSTENVSDADAININQLAVTIRKGEILELQVKSISEAGWPENPAESEWSDSIQIEFPSEIESEEEGSAIATRFIAEKSRIEFQDELNAKGLDLHLNSQFTTGERFFAHQAKDISSGFFTNEGNVVDLFEQLKNVQNSLESLQQAISLAKGVIKVSIVSPAGDSTEVKNGQTLELFAGFYRDLIKDTTGGTTVYNEGRIITSQYVLSIENSSATPLELVSLLMGGIDEVASPSDPVANPDQDYHVNRRYDLPSLSVTEIQDQDQASIKQPPGNQSAQVKSQFVYSRFKDFGLTNPLYNEGGPFDNNLYLYLGNSVSGQNVPYNGNSYLPYDPTSTIYPNGGSNGSIWIGTTNSSGAADGGGTLSEFCIHSGHPFLETLGNNYDITSTATSMNDLFKPEFAGTSQSYYPFSHGLHFETSESENSNAFNANYKNQVIRRTPVLPPSVSILRKDENYPTKLGFTPDDEYLVGKYTCGAYLYPFPLNYSVISVDGNHPRLSYKEVVTGSSNSINVPILFQFRCSDKLGNVGGFRNSGALTNVKYSKKIGIDIYIKDDVPFSFDLQVDCQYKKVTSLDAPVIPASGLSSASF